MNEKRVSQNALQWIDKNILRIANVFIQKRKQRMRLKMNNTYKWPHQLFYRLEKEIRGIKLFNCRNKIINIAYAYNNFK